MHSTAMAAGWYVLQVPTSPQLLQHHTSLSRPAAHVLLVPAVWRVLQGSYLPAAVADDLHAMQEHGQLKEAMEQLRLMFQEVR